MEMEMMRVKGKLQALITELRQLREKERVSFDQLHIHLQKHKQSDEDFSRKIRELEADLASSTQIRENLQRKVQFLEDENCLLETKQKELNQTISNILQSKQAFVDAYQESTCEMKRSIESKDKTIVMLSEKVNAHFLSLDAIRNQASLVKQVVDNAQRVVDKKEEVVARLKIEMDKVCAFENLFIEKINEYEMKLKSNENEFQRKERIIAELQSQLETTKITDRCQSKIDEISIYHSYLQESILMKEGIIQTLISGNKALRSELGMLEGTLKTIRDTMARMDEEDRAAFSLMLANQRKAAIDDKENDRINQDFQNCEANSHHKASRASVVETAASPSCKEHAHSASPVRENNNANSPPSYSPSNLIRSESQPAVNVTTVPSAEEEKDANASKSSATQSTTIEGDVSYSQKLTTILLNEFNYLPWSRAITIAL
ncbi:hypothetical protein Tco_1084146, partial [Tanacetum coccineum]